MTGAAADRDDWETLVHDVVAAGVDWIQVRDRSLDARALLAFTEAVMRAARAASPDARVLVNRRADVARAAEADGVHLGFDGLEPHDARRALGESRRAIVGISTHSSDEAGQAGGRGADYVHLAPIFDPISKEAERPALGPAALARAAALPGACHLIAQGGIHEDTARTAIEAGADGVAVTGCLLSATHPEQAAARLRATLDDAAARRA